MLASIVALAARTLLHIVVAHRAGFASPMVVPAVLPFSPYGAMRWNMGSQRS
jgi:hypothetical protein